MSMDNGSVLLKSPITMDPSQALRNLNVSGQSSSSSSSNSSNSSTTSSSSSSIIPACRRQLLASDSPGMCRRVATFPLASRGVFAKPSVLKDRSLSESEKINLMLAREGKVEIDDWRRRWAELMAASGFAPSAENKNPNNTNDSNKSNNKKKKKKVTFADCQGHQLATVKVMTEPSDVPPRLSASILRAHGIPVSEDDEENMADGGKSAAQIPASWHLGFTQPASQYAAFRRKTNEQQVALENVMLDDRCSKLTGTVKVKNISFEKTVLIRYTTDNWQSYYDKQATFQRSAGDLDTFQFQFNMPANEPASIHPHDTVQFCVCYKTGDGREFWDNNQGSNFELFNEQVRQRRNTQTLSTSASSSSSSYSSSSAADANSANNNKNNNNNDNNSNSVDANNPSTSNQLNNNTNLLQNSKNYSADSDNVDGAKHSDAFLLNMSHWGEFASSRELGAQAVLSWTTVAFG
ncbi:Protein phosphatase 1 regulatory subunit 3C-B [Trichinella patagoniensis]|uniref:Protein phosphatase 1 regulatory subunit 3C-B n=1 Tax=Trichinella patagoniensis TaxID=990121 RepID=A0A0V1AE12_9BILA|nr:Protein phosphatase 1 regulatory subunit 3C-B [Trichinella patagoniensis]